jgi:hypothetical protein
MIRWFLNAGLLAAMLVGIAACAGTPHSAALDCCEDFREPPDGNCYAR